MVYAFAFLYLSFFKKYCLMLNAIKYYLCSFLLAGLFVISCKSRAENSVAKNENSRSELLKADRIFAEMCSQKGMKNAYLEFIDSNGVLLRPNVFPIIGAEAVDFLIAQKTEDIDLLWLPKDAVVANSGELAYIYGTYKMSIKNTPEILTGSYVTIWKKQQDGKWKFVLDSNTEGLGE